MLTLANLHPSWIFHFSRCGVSASLAPLPPKQGSFRVPHIGKGSFWCQVTNSHQEQAPSLFQSFDSQTCLSLCHCEIPMLCCISHKAVQTAVVPGPNLCHLPGKLTYLTLDLQETDSWLLIS
jgi:hypothetical protein